MKKIQKMILLVFGATCVVFFAYTGSRYLRRDTKGPEIRMDKKEITASIKDTDQDLLKGVKAEDEKDGDVSDSLLIESMKMSGEKECTAVYAAFDHANNVSKASRTVKFEDYTPVHFSIAQPLRFTVGSGDQILKNIKAVDCVDGDITNRIKLTMEQQDSEYSGAGVFDYEISVSNSMGDTAVLPISVEFYTDSYEERLFHPNIYLKNYIVYLKKGSKFNAKDYLDSVSIGDALYVFDENITAEESMKENTEQDPNLMKNGKRIAGVISYDYVRHQSNVKTSDPGIYTVEYSCTTKDKYTGATQMIVVVE